MIYKIAFLLIVDFPPSSLYHFRRYRSYWYPSCPYLTLHLQMVYTRRESGEGSQNQSNAELMEAFTAMTQMMQSNMELQAQ